MWHRLARHAGLWLLPLLGLLALASCTLAPLPSTAPASAATKGDVRLSIDATRYTTHSPIGVTLVNASQGDYYAVDGRSGCAIIQLQRYDDAAKAWRSVDGCTPPQQSHVLRIPAGVREPFTLAPTSASDPNAWEPGAYRVAAAYTDNSDGTSGERIASSAGFTIQD